MPRAAGRGNIGPYLFTRYIEFGGDRWRGETTVLTSRRTRINTSLTVAAVGLRGLITVFASGVRGAAPTTLQPI